MGGKVTEVEVPEPANPETAKAARTEYADKYLALAKEWSGTPTAALSLLEAGELFAKLGNPDRALEVFLQALRAGPSRFADPSRRSRRGSLIFRRRRATSRQPPGRMRRRPRSRAFRLHADALAQAARCWAEAGKPEQALAIYQRLRSDSPDLKLAPHIEARLQEIEARGGTSPAPRAVATP